MLYGTRLLHRVLDMSSALLKRLRLLRFASEAIGRTRPSSWTAFFDHAALHAAPTSSSHPLQAYGSPSLPRFAVCALCYSNLSSL